MRFLLSRHFPIRVNYHAGYISCTLGAETFASGKIREIFAFREHKLSRIVQNRIFRVLNFREWTEKLNFFVVLSMEV